MIEKKRRIYLLRKKEKKGKNRDIEDDEYYTWKLKGRTIKKLYRIMGLLMMQEGRSFTQDELISNIIDKLPQAKGYVWVQGEEEQQELHINSEGE